MSPTESLTASISPACTETWETKAKARAEYQAAMKLPNRDYNDRHFKAEADAALRAE